MLCRGDWLKPALGAVLGLMIVLALVPVRAQSSLPVPKFDEGEVKDIDAPPLPAYPKPSSLIKFPTSWSSSEILIDADTLAINQDRVVRFTLVIKGAGGAENVSFEGLRCETGERRVYAFGRRDGTWSVARNSVWRPILDTSINRQHFEFWRDVFCIGKAIEPREKLIANIKRGGREREQSIFSD